MLKLMKNRQNSQGFAAVETVLILVIVGLIGFVGWYIWQSKSNADKAYEDSNTSSTPTSQSPKETGSVKYVTYTNPDLGYSVRYLSSWKKETNIQKGDDTGNAGSESVTFYSPDYQEDKSIGAGNNTASGAVISVGVYATTNGHKDIYAYKAAEDGIYGVGDTKDITFKGMKAVESSACGHPSADGVCVLFIKGDWLYWINFSGKRGEKATDSKYYGEYQKLLDSFNP